MQKYGQATAGRTPAKLADVANYFTPPVELSLLARYELIPQRDIPSVRLSQNPDELIVKEKRALDPGAAGDHGRDGEDAAWLRSQGFIALEGGAVAGQEDANE